MRTLLVANRGEVARRILRSAHAMGLRTVAVHTADELAEPFAREADRSVLLDGTGPEAYLDVDAIVAAAMATGADAVHPGYGFLSERADAARAVVAAGLTWVGPHPEAIATMGDKLAAKAAAAEAGVPLLPGTALEGDDEQAWVDALVDAGLDVPVLLKAAAGGGGRGMRLVADLGQLGDAVRSARREAEAAFGDGTVFAERWVARARHVEVQVVGDRHGAVVHLGERECSVQRRHQKVIEEAPSPMVDGPLRAAMGAAAVELARRIGYDSLGTVELVVDADTGGWWFLEMNTRLQVEHPVTEAVTGLDLVRLQLEVAAGAPLPFTQDDVVLDGHAIEVRVTAEDPADGWRPHAGTIVTWRPAGDGTRWDSAVEDGSVVSPRFDSLLAKAVVHAPTRAEACSRLARSLRSLRCLGVATSAGVLAAVVDDEAFRSGRLHTGLLDERLPDLVHRCPDEHLHLAALLVALDHEASATDPHWGRVRRGWRPGGPAPRRTALACGDARVEATLRDAGGDAVEVEATWGDEGTVAATVEVLAAAPAGDALSVVLAATDGGPRVVHRLTVHAHGDRRWVGDDVGQTAWRVLPRFPEAAAGAVGGGPTAPVPGKVLAVPVRPGDEVAAGQVLVVLEAMKVEHRITAAADGVVDVVLVAAGDTVDAHQVLVRLVDPAPPSARIEP